LTCAVGVFLAQGLDGHRQKFYFIEVSVTLMTNVKIAY